MIGISFGLNDEQREIKGEWYPLIDSAFDIRAGDKVHKGRHCSPSGSLRPNDGQSNEFNKAKAPS